MKRIVELIFDRDCPNIEEARINLAKALEQAGLPVFWTEIDRASEDSPAYAFGFGSPTVLVDGFDVISEKTAANTCRLYLDEDGRKIGAPPVSKIVETLLSKN